ncbi:MAG: type II toxin-antitoxin system VapC family toxin [Wenzhouxiangellaceae bacterium]|nr:type II toxin-antitoxin system VapC family toxin [Wenzhouxiangellaceae bacterium]
MSLVLDASAALAWIFERADPAEVALADRLLDAIAEQPALVPSLWHIEVANALLVAERRGVAKEAQVVDFLQRLSQLPIITDDAEISRRQEIIMALGRQFQLTAYDATYLELAMRTGSTLATFDAKLASAMQHAGGEICKQS